MRRLVLAALILTVTVGTAPIDEKQEIAKCASKEVDTARLNCYDALARSLGVEKPKADFGPGLDTSADEIIPEEPSAPAMKHRTFMGQPVSGAGMMDRGPIPRSFWRAASTEFSFRFDRVIERWRTPLEEGPGLLQEEFAEIVRDRDIPFEPGIARHEAEHRVVLYDYEQRESRMQWRPIAALLGRIGPMMLDPVNVLTLPFGGVNLSLAAAEYDV